MKLLRMNRIGKTTLSMGLALTLLAGMSTAAFASSNEDQGEGNDNGYRAPARIIAHYTPAPHYSSSTESQQQDDGNGSGYKAPAAAAAPSSKSNPVSHYVVNPAPSSASAPASPSRVNSIIDTSKSFQGRVTYRFGVRDQSHLIFDCSSFTQYVFQLNGKHIPWGSRAQANVGTYVPRDQLQPGDLVMFSVSTPGHINHVGIYMGNGQFINNLPHQGVVISNFNSTYWKSHYITGRRE